MREIALLVQLIITSALYGTTLRLLGIVMMSPTWLVSVGVFIVVWASLDIIREWGKK